MAYSQVRNLQEKLACQSVEICELKGKLSMYNEDMAKKDELQKRLNELQRWAEEAEYNMKQTNAKQFNIIDSQRKKLKKAELNEITLRAENKRLVHINECLEEQLKTQQRNEQRLVTEIEKLESSKKYLENELCEAQHELHDKTCTVEQLTKELNAKTNELLCTRKQLEECNTTVGQLKDRCKGLESNVVCAKSKLDESQTALCRLKERVRDLEADMQCTRAKLEEAKLRAAATEARLKADVDALAKELECRARKLRAAEAECDKVRSRIADEQCKASRLGALAEELGAAAERERCEANTREQRLKRDACERDEEMRRIGEQLANARRENEDAVTETTALKARTRAAECLLETAKRAAETQDRAHEEAHDCLDRDKAALACDLQQKVVAVAELERQVCRLREDVRRAVAATCCSPRPPPCAPRPTCAPRLTCSVAIRPRVESSCSGGGMTPDDSFINGLKRLYCDLEQLNENKTSRH